MFLFHGHAPGAAFYPNFLAYLVEHNQLYAFPFLPGSCFCKSNNIYLMGFQPIDYILGHFSPVDLIQHFVPAA